MVLWKENKRMHSCWSMMKYRCNTSTCSQYKDYGGRGIRVCKEWELFEDFYEWAIHNGYKDNLTLDRIDNDGNYEPSNCRWITQEEQNKTRGYCHEVTINDITKSIRDWCEIYDISYSTVTSRFKLYGWDMVEAITTPVTKRKKVAGFRDRYKKEV